MATGIRMGGERGRRARRGSDERGASLILALIFIVAVSLIVIPLADWAANALTATQKFRSVSTQDYAISSVVDTAIQAIRTTPDPLTDTFLVNGVGVAPVGTCWQPSSGSTSSYAIDGYTVNVWCQTSENLNDSVTGTRVVTFYACTSAYEGGSESACLSRPQLLAQVAFDDYPYSGGVTLSQQCNIETGSCGFSQTLNEWQWYTQAGA